MALARRVGSSQQVERFEIDEEWVGWLPFDRVPHGAFHLPIECVVYATCAASMSWRRLTTWLSPASASDADVLARLMDGADAVVHVAEFAAETDFETAVDSHIGLTHRVLEAAVAHRLARVV